MTSVLAPTDIPIDVGADAARELARRELAHPVYADHQPSLVQQFVRWLARTVDHLLDAAGAVSPGGTTGWIVLIVALVLVVVVIRWRLGATARTAAVRGGVLDAEVRTAAEHRRAADAYAGAGRFDDAVRERMRAVVRELEERTVLEPRSGRTAGEAAREAGEALPALAASLRSAARLFDETVYGGRGADADADARMRAVDEEVRAARVVPA